MEEQLEIFDGNGFELMYRKQHEFIELLISKSQLPVIETVALHLETKESQSFFRELSGFYVEELVEARIALAELVELRHERGFTTTPEFLTKLDGFNEEIADTFCFALELLIYAGVRVSELERYIEHQFVDELGDEYKASGYWIEDNLLASMLQLARVQNIRWGAYQLNITRTNVTLTHEDDSYLNVAGRRLSQEASPVLDGLNFQVIQNLYTSLNMMKSKYWRAEEVPINEIDLRRSLCTWFMSYLQLLDMYGVNEMSTLKNYINKHEKNLNRQKEGY